MKLKFRKLPTSFYKKNSFQKVCQYLPPLIKTLIKKKQILSIQIQEVISHFNAFCLSCFFDLPLREKREKIEKDRDRLIERETESALISRYPHETSAQETNWISLPRHANDRIPFPRLEVVGTMHLLARSSGGWSRWRHSSENRITAAVERVPFPRVQISGN